MNFTDEETRILKEFAQERLVFERIFLYDEKGNRIPQGNYSDMVEAMWGKKVCA